MVEMSSIRSLPLFFQGKFVGTLRQEKEVYSFQYDNNWIQTGFSISPHIPFSGDTSSGAIVNFLLNLFPEGEAFDILVSSLRVRKSNVLSILEATGQDGPGAISFGDTEQKIDELREITPEELTDRLDSGDPSQIVIWDGKYRLSVAGVQRKLNILIEQERFFLADGQYASTHIMKFAKPDHRHLVVNEYVCMQLGRQADLVVAETSYLQFGQHPALLVKRFDRVLGVSSASIKKRHVIDGCQLLDFPPNYKYEQVYGSGRDVANIRDGVSIPKLFNAVKQARIPAHNRLIILDWILFNLIIGNSDAHGKNISFMVDRAGFNVAPIYDLVSISFAGLSNDKLDTGLAMAIDDEFDLNDVSAYNLVSMAERVGLPPRLVKRRLALLLDKVMASLDKIDLSDLLNEDREFAEKLKKHIHQRADYFKEGVEQFDPVIKGLK